MAEWGPMRLSIASFVGKVPQREMNLAAAEEAFDCLERVARLRKELRKPLKNKSLLLKEPLGARMLESVHAIGDRNLTPMAAVAGTIADGVADFLFSRGLTKVIINNGGDISVRLMAPHSVWVGLREDVNSEGFSSRIPLNVPPKKEGASFGVATSGLGGRSLTCGIASAATIIANTASLADAAATAVANASFVDHPGVVRRPAETMDTQTDIAGIPVTVQVQELDHKTRRNAISQSLALAEELVKRGTILGAMVAVDGKIGMTSFFENHIITDIL